MRRITVSLPEDLAAMVDREAERTGMSISALVREALNARLGIQDELASPPIVALGRSGKRHTARDAETILAREWAR